MRTVALLLVLIVTFGAFGHSASQAPDIVDRARAIYPALQNAAAPSLTLLPAADSTALGCALLTGLPLPDPLDVYRLGFPLDGGVFAVHVSADGSLAQACDERLPNLGAGTQWVARVEADSDGDGYLNDSDDCPFIAGAAASKQGCPLKSAGDRDGDGIPDGADRCAEQAGAAAADGCALLADSDGDGVPNHIDICSADFGPYRADLALGCPADGSGSSTRRRGAADTCRVSDADALIHESGDAASEVIGSVADAASRVVIGRSAAGDWLQLEAGWVAVDGLRLSGACHNIPLVNAEAGGATGCFLRPRGEFVNAREGPAGTAVTVLTDERPQAVLGSNFAGDWLMFRAGWVSREVVELSGSCDSLPALDPAVVSSGIIHFCPPGFRGYLRPRIAVGGGKARVVSDTLANRLRAQPSIEAEQIGEIAPRGSIDAVLDGPACNGPWVWWQVEVDGLVGWTVESDVNYNYYYLEPVADTMPADESPGPPADAPLPTAGRVIHSGNIDSLDTVAILPVAGPQAVAWSPQQGLLALRGADGALTLFDAADFQAQEQNWGPASKTKAIAFSPDERWLALGDRSGSVSLLDLEHASLRSEARHIGQLEGPIHGLAWSRAGDKLAAVSGAESLKLARRAGTLKVWTMDSSAPENSSLALHQRYPYPLTSLAYSADDRWLALTGESTSAGRAALWVYAADSGELQFAKPLIPLRGHSSVAASPAGSLGDFVYSSGDSLRQLDVASGVEQRIYHLDGALLRTFAFRPQALAGAEVLLALAVERPSGAGQLQLANALSPYGSATSFDISPSAVAFRPDGRLLALADSQRDRVLILAVTES